jgi:ATP-dependent DNA helicase RecG
MPINAESLLKILSLEKQRGCADTAVIGGLDKFLANWSAGAVESLNTPRVLRQFHKLFKSNPRRKTTPPPRSEKNQP